MKEFVARHWTPLAMGITVVAGWAIMLGTDADWEVVAIAAAVVLVALMFLGDRFGRRSEPGHGAAGVAAQDSSGAGFGGSDTKSGKDSNWFSDFFGGDGGGGDFGGGGGDGGGG